MFSKSEPQRMILLLPAVLFKYSVYNESAIIGTHVFLSTCMLCFVYSLPTGILRLPWLRVFHAFSWVVRQMPEQNPQRQGTARTLPSCCVALCIFCVVLCIVCFVTFPVLFVCICVLYYCHRVATQLQLTNISHHNLTHIIMRLWLIFTFNLPFGLGSPLEYRANFWM